VLLVGIDRWPTHWFASPEAVPGRPDSVTGRAAWFSFAFLLRTAAAALLDVDVAEVQAGTRTVRADDGRVHGQAFLCDTLENGAGYCRYLAHPTHTAELLGKAADVVDKWTAPAHAGRCDTSCNDCLRDFYNMPYHGLLDWRLAADMLAVAGGKDVPPDLTGLPTTSHWRPLVGHGPAPITTALAQFGYARIDLPFGPCFGVEGVTLVPVHPLMATLPAGVVNVLPSARRLDPFIAIRRPADYL
jgi:DEAD/DEAH box helicase domain-containing protein